MGRWRVSTTLKVIHSAIGAEVRRAPYDVLVDGQLVASVEMNDAVEIPVEPGRHSLQVRSGRDRSGREDFEIAEGQVVEYRATGKRFLPLFLASFVFRGLALVLERA